MGPGMSERKTRVSCPDMYAAGLMYSLGNCLEMGISPQNSCPAGKHFMLLFYKKDEKQTAEEQCLNICFKMHKLN